MRTLRRLFPILLIWLLFAAGLSDSPMPTGSVCAMPSSRMAASHACCVQRPVCACPAGAQGKVQNALAKRLSGQTACACALDAKPFRSAPQTQAASVVLAAILPARASPRFAAACAASSILTNAPASPLHSVRVLASPPRAPPFLA